MIKHPSITVIMPVFNTEKYVKDAIQSILDQSFSDFEFIIINDGSTDESLNIIRSFEDKRIILLNNPSNYGNYPSRNKGLSVAKGKYICVMDADDIAISNRFERQFIFMEENPEIGLAGSGFRYFGKEQKIFRENDYEKIKVILLRTNCFVHPTLIIRHDFLRKYKLQYNEKYYYSSDYDMICRAARFFPITNIPEILLNYRIHKNQITLKNRQNQIEYADHIIIEQLRYIGINTDEVELQLHSHLLKGWSVEYSKKQTLFNWINKVLNANQSKKYYKEDELESFFIALLSQQSFCNEEKPISLKSESSDETKKTDLMDITFLVPLRIDSHERQENVNALIKSTFKIFDTSFIVLEADETRKYFPEHEPEGFQYQFIEDTNEVFHRTKWINHLISIAKTPFIAVWDADAIAPPEQILNAVELLRARQAVMSFPYDGRFYSCDKVSCDLFKSILDIEILIRHIPVMKLMHGYHSVGGAFLVNKEKYLEAGGENENFYGWGPEDAERVKRMEVLNLSVYYSSGPSFHLCHPQGKNSWFANPNIEKHNRKELQKTSKLCILNAH